MASDPDHLEESTAIVTTAQSASVPAKSTAVPTGISRQLFDLPRSELDRMAMEFGLDPADYKTPQHLIAALHERRQLIAMMDRDAMLDVLRWAHKPITQNASNELIAQQIAGIRSMRFHGLSQRGLVVLARLRGVPLSADDSIPEVIKKLKKQEGFFAKINRKRRAMIGGWVSSLIGENVAPRASAAAPPPASPAEPRRASEPHPEPSIKQEIEDSGLFSGLTNRIKKTADSYLNQKLDEVEARIDRKLDEIDRRLAEWRDKEIANRLRILKITLWASVIVGAFSLIYSYIKVYFGGG